MDVAFGFIAHLTGGGVDVAACPDGLSGGNPTSLFRMDVVTRYDKSHLDEDGQSSCALVLTG